MKKTGKFQVAKGAENERNFVYAPKSSLPRVSSSVHVAVMGHPGAAHKRAPEEPDETSLLRMLYSRQPRDHEARRDLVQDFVEFLSLKGTKPPAPLFVSNLYSTQTRDKFRVGTHSLSTKFSTRKIFGRTSIFILRAYAREECFPGQVDFSFN